MKRGLRILILGLVGGALTYGAVYLAVTDGPRSWLRSSQPELAWLRDEFRLGDAEFRRISELHAGYQPGCRERCRAIQELDGRLATALSTASQVTPEMESLLEERARMRARCQAEMLRHFFEVSRTMPPEQGKRYLTWVRGSSCLLEHSMHAPDGAAPATPSTGHVH